MIWLLACAQIHSTTGSKELNGFIEHAGVYLPFGMVTLQAGKADYALFEWTSHYDTEEPTVMIDAANGVVTSQVDCLRNSACGVNMVVTLPAETSVESDILSGDISVSGFSDEIIVSTAEGSLLFDGLSGNVTASVETGDITATNLTSPGFHGGGVTGNRDIRFESAPLVVELNTVDGNIQLAVPSGPYAVTASASGEMTVTGLEDDPTQTHVIEATTSSGNLRIEGF